jgi:REP element-mobilizing transposase RayT
MARPLRIEFKGALYHILSRGNERRNIFFGDDDYKESDVELPQLNRIIKDKDPAKLLSPILQGRLYRRSPAADEIRIDLKF